MTCLDGFRMFCTRCSQIGFFMVCIFPVFVQLQWTEVNGPTVFGSEFASGAALHFLSDTPAVGRGYRVRKHLLTRWETLTE
jgi:hypothetical protein